MNDIVTERHLKNAQKLRALISKYQENRDLIIMWGYAQGQDPELILQYQFGQYPSLFNRIIKRL